MMSKPCLKSSLFVTPIFIYSEAGGYFLVGGVTQITGKSAGFLEWSKKMTDIAQDDEDGVSAHRP